MKTGDRLGPYQILAPIGVGGMGEVYKACKAFTISSAMFFLKVEEPLQHLLVTWRCLTDAIRNMSPFDAKPFND